MQKDELTNAFLRAVVRNDLYKDDIISIPKGKIYQQFMDDFYAELVSSEECRARKKYYFNYIRKVMREKEWYINEAWVLDFVNGFVHDEIDFEDVKEELGISRNWSMFWERIEKRFRPEDEETE